MTACITIAGESLIALKQGTEGVLKIARFVLANVPDLDPTAPVNRDVSKPPAEQIVHVQDVTQAGFVNPNQVVYSLMMGSDIGDFDWNWIGLESAEDVLVSVAYVPLQQKRKNALPGQIGNNVTRNFMLVFDGAQALTEITIDASTWQHDFTVRLHGIDERERLANRDVYGRACFVDDGFLLAKHENRYYLNNGLAYVEGIRLSLKDWWFVEEFAPSFPTTLWLDVALTRENSDAQPSYKLRWGVSAEDYLDSAGVQHYCVPIADLSATEPAVDRRVVEVIKQPLVFHFASRTGDYQGLRARATTKADVGLSALPNAKSDDPQSNSSDVLATTAALMRLQRLIDDEMVGMVAAFDKDTAPPGWLKRNGANVSRITYARLFAVIGTRYGAGDGSTTFNVGDSRGLFIRGLDDGRGLDAGRGLGTEQSGQNLAHIHAASAAAAGNHDHTGATNNAGHHAHTVGGSTNAAGHHAHDLTLGGPWGGSVCASTYNSRGDGGMTSTHGAGEHSHSISGNTNATGDHAHTLIINPNGNHSHAISIGEAGGSENRPRNTALLFCIKY